MDKKSTIGVLGGGFKPPTKGHFELVKFALNKFPEIDEFIVFIGGKSRDGIGQAESLLVWEIYQNYLPMKVKIKPSTTSPIGEIYSYAKENQDKNIYWILGERDEVDKEDNIKRSQNLDKKKDKYNNVFVKQISTSTPTSGTQARKALKFNSFDKFVEFIPSDLSEKDKKEVFKILTPTHKQNLNEEALYSNHIDYKQKIKELTKYMLNKGMNIIPLPKVRFIHSDSSNAKDFFGKTAYYDPNNKEIVLYIEGRHPKDIVRSFAHEIIHHKQNLEGRLNDVNTTNTNEDGGLENIEKEAYLDGNMTFRNWTDSLNENILPQEKFTQEQNQDYIKQALKILPNKDKYNLKDYTVEILPIDKVKPTQFREDYINTSSEYEAEQYQKYLKGEIDIEDLRKEDFYSIVVDRDTMEILDGNHRHAVHTMLGIPKIKAILVSKKLNEAKSYKHKHGFDDKLGKDPFGLNQYARELAQGLEEETNITEGKYDSLITKLTNNLLKIIKDSYKATLNKSGKYKNKKIFYPNNKNLPPAESPKHRIYLDTVYNNTPDLNFILLLNMQWVKGGENNITGFTYNDPKKYSEIIPIIEVVVTLNSEDYPKNLETTSYNISDVLRHEIEHLTQTGYNVKPGKYLKSDQEIRDKINNGELSAKEYFLLPQEIPAMLYGLYTKAKKTKQPFKKIIDDYLDRFINMKDKEGNPYITPQEKQEIINTWKPYLSKLSLPQMENQQSPPKLNPQNIKIFSDMDGVLTDFDKRFKQFYQMLPKEFEEKYGTEKFWGAIDDEIGVRYWVGMPWTEDGKLYWDYISQYNPTLLSAPSKNKVSHLGKKLWVKNNLPGVKLILSPARNKSKYADKNSILIDDRIKNIESWEQAGGIGIHHTNAENTIKELKKLGL